MLKFNHEDVQEFIDKLDDIIRDIEEDIEETEDLKNEVKGVAKANSIDAYGEYGVELADYKNSLEFYEGIRDDLKEFLDEVDGSVKFIRDPNFKYDEQLKEEINNLIEETGLLRNRASLNTSTGSREYTPYPSPYERGNFFHRGSPEEELIDSNDGIMKSWAEEINYIFGKLMDSEHELERLHKLYFEDISLNEWKRRHDKSDGIAENSREWHRLGVASTSIVGIGASVYSYKVSSGSSTAYSSVRNPEMDFKNGKKLESHYDNHGTILGYSTSGEYLNASRNFLEKPPTSTTKSFTSEGNTYFRYDSKTGEFGIMNSYGGVSTYFIPDEPELYWEEQVKLYAPKKY